MSDTLLPEDDELLAAELAFGLIDGAEKRAAEARWQPTTLPQLTPAGRIMRQRCSTMPARPPPFGVERHRGTPAGQ
jgi:hypothetical protein